MDLTNLIQELYHTKPIIKKTSLGLSNDIYKAVINDKKYAIRVPKNDIHKHLNTEERTLLNQIKTLDLDVKEVYYDEDTKIRITEWIDNGYEYQDCPFEDKWLRAVKLIKKLHNADLKVNYRFDSFKMYHSFKREIKNPLMDYSKYEKVFQMIDSSKEVFSHNDLVSGNFIFTKDRDYLIDYEYAGMNHPYFDIMSFITENNIDDKVLRKKILKAYFDKIDDHLLEELHKIEAMQNLLWGAWANMLYDSRNEDVYLTIFKDKYSHLTKGEI